MHFLSKKCCLVLYTVYSGAVTWNAKFTLEFQITMQKIVSMYSTGHVGKVRRLTLWTQKQKKKYEPVLKKKNDGRSSFPSGTQHPGTEIYAGPKICVWSK